MRVGLKADPRPTAPWVTTMRLFERHREAENLQELERWRVTCAKYEIWLSEFPEIALTLRNLRAEASGEALDACWPPLGKGPWVIEGLRQAIRKPLAGYQPIETGARAAITPPRYPSAPPGDE